MAANPPREGRHQIDAFRSEGLEAYTQGDREALKRFITKDAAGLFEYVASDDDGDGVELGAPEYYETVEDAPKRDSASSYPAFDPKGWVGLYPGGFEVTQNRVEEDAFRTMRSDVAMWIETAGPATAKSVLRFLPDVAIRRAETYRSYSQRLIEETEEVLAHRPPVTTKFSRETGQQVRGRPLPAQTAQERGKGRQTVVSQRVEFTLETLPNLLLIRFHLELAGSLSELATDVPAFGETISGNATYHREFVTDQFKENLTEKALSMEFDDPSLLAETRQEATPAMNRVIDLWEGYRTQTPLASEISDRLDTAILPAEKIYELYVLAKLLELLEDIAGESAEIGEGGVETPIQVGSWSLHYDRRISANQSRLFSPVFTNFPAYRPDYVLEHDGEIVWFGDAKFRGSLDRDDGNRFLRYLVDLLPAGTEEPAVGTLFVPDIQSKRHMTEAGDYRIDVSKLCPGIDSNDMQWLRERVVVIN